MERIKKILRTLCFPPIAVVFLLLPAAAVALIYSMTALASAAPGAIASYVLSAYTLLIWCVRIPWMLRWLRDRKEQNRYVKRWLEDLSARVSCTLLAGCLWNLGYSVFQLCLGLYHHTFWYGSLSAYYFLLGMMRMRLALYTRAHGLQGNMAAQWKRYRACGWVLLAMNLTLSAMVFFMVCWGRTFRHHQITTIAMAAYTFTSLTLAIVNLVKKRKLGSPVLLASKAISLACACVSMLTLTTTMLTAFGSGEDPAFRRLMLGLTGGGVSFVIITMAVYMLRRASASLKIVTD